MSKEGQLSGSLPEKLLELFNGKLLIAHMATRRPDGHLSVVPVGAVIHEGQLRVSSPTRTRKISNLQRDPHIALCITQPDDYTRYTMVRGTAELAEDVDRTFVDWLARTHMGVEEYPYEPRKVSRTIITIRPHRIVMPKVHGQH